MSCWIQRGKCGVILTWSNENIRKMNAFHISSCDNAFRMENVNVSHLLKER